MAGVADRVKRTTRTWRAIKIGSYGRTTNCRVDLRQAQYPSS